MGEHDNLIFDAYKLYLKDFEPYTYRITLRSESISIVSPKDRFPHLVGLNTIFEGEKAGASIVMLDDTNNKYKISEIRKSFNTQYKQVKRKIVHFQHLDKLFKDVSFYKIYSLTGKKQGSHILLNIVDTEEINLVIDKASDSDKIYRGNYIPRSYLVNTRENKFGQYVNNGVLEEIVKLEQIENKTSKVSVLYYNELLEKNTSEFIQKDLFKFKFKDTTNLIKFIINFNQKTNHYHPIDQILIIKTSNSKYYSDNKTDIDNILYEMEKQTVNEVTEKCNDGKRIG